MFATRPYRKISDDRRKPLARYGAMGARSASGLLLCYTTTWDTTGERAVPTRKEVTTTGWERGPSLHVQGSVWRSCGSSLTHGTQSADDRMEGFDPLLPFKIDTVNGRRRRGSGLRRMALVGSSAGVPENKLGTGLFGRPTSKDRSQLCPLIQLRSASGPPYVSGSATRRSTRSRARAAREPMAFWGRAPRCWSQKIEEQPNRDAGGEQHFMGIRLRSSARYPGSD